MRHHATQVLVVRNRAGGSDVFLETWRERSVSFVPLWTETRRTRLVGNGFRPEDHRLNANENLEERALSRLPSRTSPCSQQTQAHLPFRVQVGVQAEFASLCRHALDIRRTFVVSGAEQDVKEEASVLVWRVVGADDQGFNDVWPCVVNAKEDR